MKNNVFKSLSVEPVYASQYRVDRYDCGLIADAGVHCQKRKQLFLVSVGQVYNAGDTFPTIT